MATAELVVAFSAKIDSLETSLKRVTTELGNLQAQANQTQRSVTASTESMSAAFTKASSSIRNFIAVYVGIQAGQAIRQIITAVDDLNGAFRRLQVLTGLTRSAVGDVVSELQRISAATGQPLDGLINQFQRFYVATASIGATTAQVQQFVNVLSQFAQVSGQGPQEAAAAITQLAQGLASGRLQGDELRSIMENMPALAQSLAQELGVSVGELRKMGTEGKLTAENVFPAILRAGQRMTETMRGMPLTLRQAWEAFKTSAVSAIAAVDSAVGASAFFTEVLNRAGAALRSATTAAAGTDYVANGGRIAEALQNVNREIVSTNQNITELENRLRSLPTGRQPFLTGPAGVRRVGNREEIEADLAAARERANRLEEARADLAERIRIREEQEAGRRSREARDQRIAQADAEARTIRETANPILEAQRERDKRLEDLRKTLDDRRARAVEANRQGDIEAINRWGREQEAAIQRIYEREARQAGAGAREAANAAEAARRRAEREARAQRQADARQIEEIYQSAGNGIQVLLRQYAEWDAAQERTRSNYELFIERIRSSQNQIGEVGVLFDAVRVRAEQAAAAMYRAGYDPQEAIQALNAELATLRDRLVAAGVPAEQVDEAVRSQIQRATRALDQVKDKSEQTWKDIATQGARAFSSDLAGSLVDFAATGEAKFDEMAANFAKNIAKMILQMMILRAIMAGFNALRFPLQPVGGVGVGRSAPSSNPYGAAAGGQGATPLSKASNGAPSYFMSSGPSVPTVSGAQPAEVTVNVYNNSSNSQARTQETTDSLGNKRIEVIVEDIVRGGLASGRYDNTMRASYGLTRSGRV